MRYEIHNYENKRLDYNIKWKNVNKKNKNVLNMRFKKQNCGRRVEIMR